MGWRDMACRRDLSESASSEVQRDSTLTTTLITSHVCSQDCKGGASGERERFPRAAPRLLTREEGDEFIPKVAWAHGGDVATFKTHWLGRANVPHKPKAQKARAFLASKGATRIAKLNILQETSGITREHYKMSSYSRDKELFSEDDEDFECEEVACGSVPPSRSAALHQSVLPRAGSFTNLDDEHEPLQFPRDENISAKIDEVCEMNMQSGNYVSCHMKE